MHEVLADDQGGDEDPAAELWGVVFVAVGDFLIGPWVRRRFKRYEARPGESPARWARRSAARKPEMSQSPRAWVRKRR